MRDSNGRKGSIIVANNPDKKSKNESKNESLLKCGFQLAERVKSLANE